MRRDYFWDVKVLIKIKHAFLKRFFPDFLLMGLVVPNIVKFEKDTKLSVR